MEALSGSGDRYTRFYTFTISETANVTISLSSEEDTNLIILEGHGKDGDTLHENDVIQSGGVNLNSRISAILQPGDYTIEATTYHAEGGTFTLVIEGLGERSATARPDLEVGTPLVDDANPATGEVFTLSATVINAGEGESEATTVRYYRSTDSTITSGDTEVGTDSVGALSASETSDQSIQLAAPFTAGTYHFGACADSVADESDRSDNCSASVSITIVS